MDYTALKFARALPLQVMTGSTANAGEPSVTNKINGLDNRTLRIGAGAAVARSTADKAAATQAQSPGTTPSEVQITGAARTLVALEQKLRDAPAVDEARVAAIRQKLEDGSYQIDPQRIADKLLGLERDLGGNKGTP
jgi:negative regulator of flagellin synthesis FlgM